MLTKKEVQHIAKLARLGLTPVELNKMRKELSSILDYIEKLKEVDVSGIKPASHTIKIENIARSDKSERPKQESKKLLELAPETKDGYLKVKSPLK